MNPCIVPLGGIQLFVQRQLPSILFSASHGVILPQMIFYSHHSCIRKAYRRPCNSSIPPRRLTIFNILRTFSFRPLAFHVTWIRVARIVIASLFFAHDAFACQIQHWRSMSICHIIKSGFIAIIQQRFFRLATRNAENILCHCFMGNKYPV